MIVVGVTGGIGSGKTTVVQMFHSLGIPIYIADEESKKLLVTSKVIKRKLRALFGEEAYHGNQLNRKFLADKIFNNRELLTQMNAIVHPKVGAHFKKWLKKQKAPYVIKESAILFESNAYKDCDYIITVVANEKTRISRVLKRDSTTKEKLKKIMENQLPDEDKIKRSNYTITNDNLEDTEKQVFKIHGEILKTIKKS
ncbi:MAG: dephospho-CoA kinase [Mangrovimonas sp.]|nr:dephospho-CoA kinase [Mangrovimonas sp.]